MPTPTSNNTYVGGGVPPPPLDSMPPPPPAPNSATAANSGGGGGNNTSDPPLTNPECNVKDLNKMFGMTASDIDKYSRIFFPVSFTSFQLMYWIIYQHLSDEVVNDLVYLHPE